MGETEGEFRLEEATQRGGGVVGRFELFSERRQGVDALAVDRDQQRTAVGEVPVQRADADACPGRDLLERHVRAGFGEGGRRGLDDALPVAHRVGAHRPMSLRRDGRH